MDQVIFIDSSDTQYTLHDDSTKMVTSMQGVGMPEVEHFSQRTPFQHGEQHIGYRYLARKIAVGIYRYPATRDLLYTDHQTLISAFRPSRGVGKLRWTLNDGTVRQIDVWFSGGLSFNTDNQHAFTRQIDVIELTAYDPLWYDPTQVSVEYSMSGSSDNFFPFSLPWTPLGGGISNTKTVTNSGNENTWPTIVVMGPGENPIITNQTSDKVISISYTLLASEYITIDQSVGAKTITLTSSGGAQSNIIGYMSSDSEFFELGPGDSSVRCEMNATSSDSKITVSYYNRYLGV